MKGLLLLQNAGFKEIEIQSLEVPMINWQNTLKDPVKRLKIQAKSYEKYKPYFFFLLPLKDYTKAICDLETDINEWITNDA